MRYLDISDTADEAVDSLIAELSQLPLSRDDARTAEPLARIWHAVFDNAPHLVAIELDSTAASSSSEELAVDTPHNVARKLVVPPIPSPLWKLVGFQGNDPSTDLRAARLAGLLYLSRLVETESQAAAMGRAAASGEMPMAVCSMNVLYALRCHLALLPELPSYCPCCGTKVRAEATDRSAQPHGGRHLRGFALLLLDDPDALYHIYACAVLLCGQIWDRRFGTSVMGAVTERQTKAGPGKVKHNGHRRKVAPEPPSPASVTVANPLTNSSGGGGEGDFRLMEFPSILAEAVRSVLEQLARLPGDVGVLRARLSV